MYKLLLNRSNFLIFLLVLGVSSCKARPNDDSSLRAEAVGGDYSGIGHNGDGLTSWVDGEEVTDWEAEKEKRQKAIYRYLYEQDTNLSKKWGYKPGQNSKVAWKWFEESPVGFGGVPYVVLKTILDLNKTNCIEFKLCGLVDIWQKQAKVGNVPNNLDHLGFGPHPADYDSNGKALPPSKRAWKLPYGFVFQSGKPSYESDKGPFYSSVDSALENPNYRTGIIEAAELDGLKKIRSHTLKMGYLRGILTAKRTAQKTTLGLAKLSQGLGDLMRAGDKAENSGKHSSFYSEDYKKFGQSTGLDRVFFSCAGCHTGRVIVDGKVKHIPGAPNSEIEAQYFSRLLMETGAALVTGFDFESKTLINPANIKAKSDLVQGLYAAMLTKAIDEPGSFYGNSNAQKLRGRMMAFRAAWKFPAIVKDLIGIAVKTQYIYKVVGAQNAYKPDVAARRAGELGYNIKGKKLPGLMGDRVGQMDAFGIASGLISIHTRREDNSFMKFLYQDSENMFGTSAGKNSIFTGFEGLTNKDLSRKIDVASIDDEKALKAAADRVFTNVQAWAPPVAAPIDIKNLNWARDRAYANWDGNQAAVARTLASGTSATGDSRKVNVEIHEPQNPFIENLPPTPYPFAVDIAKAKEGKQIYEKNCTGCHKPKNTKIYAANVIGVDPFRSITNTSVSRKMLAGLTLEACSIFKNNSDGNDWCMPEDGPAKEKLSNYFKDTPLRVRNKENGYKADMLHGIWSNAPYLHNGSVPTLAQLICPDTRPAKFVRGNIHYDKDFVGFEWQNAPKERYSEHDSIQFKTYDTSYVSRSNSGHTMEQLQGWDEELCGELKGTKLDPSKDRNDIRTAFMKTKAAKLVEYLKTL